MKVICDYCHKEFEYTPAHGQYILEGHYFCCQKCHQNWADQEKVKRAAQD